MYNRLKLLVEGLSLASKHYLLLNRRKKNPTFKARGKEISIAQFKVKKTIPRSNKRELERNK